MAGEPAIGGKIYSALSKATVANLNAFLLKRGFLPRRSTSTSVMCISEHSTVRRKVAQAYLGLMTPLELTIRCQGTVSLL